MRTVEDYWKDFEKFGFIKHSFPGKIDYILEPHKGQGGFSILGDPTSAMAVISDCTLYKPLIVKEFVDERIIEVSQYYEGSASYYEKKSDVNPFEYGLNACVNTSRFYGYKRIEPHIRLLNIGFVFREKFFSSLPIKLESDFWERATNILNPNLITLPKITAICDSLKTCRLKGDPLQLFIQGKSLEVFSLLYDDIYAKTPTQSVYLSQKDKKILNEVKSFIETHYKDSFTIVELTKKFAINQQKLVTGFKDTFNITIHGYTKKLRMTKALELLYDEDLLIIEIAKAVGYYGDGYFQKLFKETYGISPSQMRKELLL